jgi:hypothetical protein
MAMRAVELAKVAAAAEALRLRRFARRQAIRAGLGVGAVVFAIAVFVLLHVLAYDALVNVVRPWLAALILLVVDLVIAGVLGALAMRNQPDQVETEALAVRRQAVVEMKRAVTVMAVASELTGLVIHRRARQAAATTRRSRAWMLADIASRVVGRR